MNWRDFIVFLHKEGVYKEYRSEFNKCCLNNSIPIQEHIKFLKNISDIFFLELSFAWEMTNNGVMFWGDINLKWRKYLNGTDLA